MLKLYANLGKNLCTVKNYATKRSAKDIEKRMVGETGFEPATPCTQNKCATKLRYSPTYFQKFGKSRPGRGLTTGANITCWTSKRQTLFCRKRSSDENTNRVTLIYAFIRKNKNVTFSVRPYNLTKKRAKIGALNCLIRN